VNVTRNAIAAALLALSLAACTYDWDPARGEAIIVSPGNFKAGSGQIYQVGVLPNANKDKGSKDPNLYRLYLRMDATGTQYVDVDRSTFMAGEFVDLTNDGRVVRLSGTTLNEALRR
jgi:hypothetical protein